MSSFCNRRLFCMCARRVASTLNISAPLLFGSASATRRCSGVGIGCRMRSAGTFNQFASVGVPTGTPAATATAVASLGTASGWPETKGEALGFSPWDFCNASYTRLMARLSSRTWRAPVFRLLRSGYPWCAEDGTGTVSYTHLRAHETDSYLVCRL